MEIALALIKLAISLAPELKELFDKLVADSASSSGPDSSTEHPLLPRLQAILGGASAETESARALDEIAQNQALALGLILPSAPNAPSPGDPGSDVPPEYL